MTLFGVGSKACPACTDFNYSAEPRQLHEIFNGYFQRRL